MVKKHCFAKLNLFIDIEPSFSILTATFFWTITIWIITRTTIDQKSSQAPIDQIIYSCELHLPIFRHLSKTQFYIVSHRII